MKTKFIAVVAVSLLVTGQWTSAGEENTPAAELQALVTKIKARMKELVPPTPPGTPRKPATITEADLAAELKEFDALLAKYEDQKSDDVAQILYMKGSLYAEVLRNETKANEMMAQLKADFPDSRQAANLRKQEEAKKIQDSLAVGSKFPHFNEKDLEGKPLSLADYKGKVVLIDFWAVWCGPCVKELPHVLKAYEKHHDNGFEIIGISLDQDKAKLEAFIRENKMPWQQFFDGQGWKNKLSTQYGVKSIPATYLIDGEGTIIGKNLRGEALETAVAKALGKS